MAAGRVGAASLGRGGAAGGKKEGPGRGHRGRSRAREGVGPNPLNSLAESTGGDFDLVLLLRAGLAAPPPGFGRPRPLSAGRAGHARSEDLWADGAGAAGGAATGSVFRFLFLPFSVSSPTPEGAGAELQTVPPTLPPLVSGHEGAHSSLEPAY